MKKIIVYAEDIALELSFNGFNASIVNRKGEAVEVDLEEGYSLDIARNFYFEGSEQGLWEGAIFHNGRMVFPKGSPCENENRGFLDLDVIIAFAEKCRAWVEERRQV